MHLFSRRLGSRFFEDLTRLAYCNFQKLILKLPANVTPNDLRIHHRRNIHHKRKGW